MMVSAFNRVIFVLTLSLFNQARGEYVENAASDSMKPPTLPVQQEGETLLPKSNDQKSPDRQPQPKTPVPIPMPPVPIEAPAPIPSPIAPPPVEETLSPPPPLPSDKEPARIDYENILQRRLIAAADEIATLKSSLQNLKGTKQKKLREYLRTAAGNRSMARTKLKQLRNAPLADWTRLKAGTEQAMSNLELSVKHARMFGAGT